MAVNKITNKQVVNKELVNRANEVSTKGTTIRGNRETTIVPGNNFSDNFSITLKDVDTAVLNHVKNVMKPRVREANETFKIPVFYGNEERNRSIRNVSRREQCVHHVEPTGPSVFRLLFSSDGV